MSFDSILQLPIGWAYLTLFAIVMLRANATYWAGRLLVAGGRLSPQAKRFIDGPAMVRAKDFSARWGVLAVPLSFLTIGVQTAVNLSAGALRMPLSRYLPAVTLGCLLWALLYSSIGLAAVQALLLALASSYWSLLAIAVVIALVVGMRLFHRHAVRRTQRTESTAGER